VVAKMDRINEMIKTCDIEINYWSKICDSERTNTDLYEIAFDNLRRLSQTVDKLEFLKRGLK
jgi:hypothetical protein